MMVTKNETTLIWVETLQKLLLNGDKYDKPFIDYFFFVSYLS